MNESNHGLGSNLAKIDEHIITQEEYDEIPELTDEWFEQADLYEGGRLVRRGRRSEKDCATSTPASCPVMSAPIRESHPVGR